MSEEESIPESDITGIVLCGGRSSRFGTSKAHFVYHGSSLAERAVRTLNPVVSRLVLGIGDLPDEHWPAVDLVPDESTGLGPIGGLQAGFRAGNTDWLFVLAVDLPFVTGRDLLSLVRAVQQTDNAVVAVDESHRVQPLLALYRRSVGPVVDRLIDRNELAMKHLLSTLDCVRYVTLPELALRNVNRPEDLDG